jgi:hypothetical protein
MDPEGRIRTGISVVDSDALYRLSYLGVVPEVYSDVTHSRKMALSDAVARALAFRDGLGRYGRAAVRAVLPRVVPSSSQSDPDSHPFERVSGAAARKNAVQRLDTYEAVHWGDFSDECVTSLGGPPRAAGVTPAGVHSPIRA